MSHCVSPNVMLTIQYALYIIFLETLNIPSGEGVLSSSSSGLVRACVGCELSCTRDCSPILVPLRGAVGH